MNPRPLITDRFMDTRIYLTRHGLSEHNLIMDVFMGRSPESRLLEEGREQARSLGARLRGKVKGGRIVHSSLPRTTETAQLIAMEAGVEELIPEDAFWELSKGDWEGRMPRKLPADVQCDLDADPFGYRYPGGESYQDVARRAAPAFEKWVGKYPGTTLLFVLHGDVFRALLYHMVRFPPEKIGDFQVDPCSLTEFLLVEGVYRMVRCNDVSHLDSR